MAKKLKKGKKVRLDETMVKKRTSAYQNIFQELRLEDNEEFRRYLRMNTETFQVQIFIYFYIYLFIYLSQKLSRKIFLQ